MSTTTKSNDSSNYVDFDEYINYQIQKTRSNIKFTDLLTGVGGVLTAVLSYLLIFVVFDHWVVPGGFGYLARVTMLGLLVVGALSWFSWRVGLRYFKKVNQLYAAQTIERAEPELESSLLTLLDLRRAGRKVSDGILRALEKRSARTLSEIDVNQVVDHRPLMRISYTLLFVVTLFCLYVLFSPKKIGPSVWAALLPTEQRDVSTQTDITDVRPGNVTVLAREQLEVTADILGEEPERVTLFFSTSDRRYVNEPLEMHKTDPGLKRYQVLLSGENGRGILQDLDYYIVAGDDQTEKFHVQVIQPPSAEIEKISYKYPEYMEFQDREEATGHIDAWEGTTVALQARTNMPVKWAVLQFGDDEHFSTKAEELPLEIKNGRDLSVTWKMKFRSDGSFPHFYRIQCKSTEGYTNPDLAVYNINVRPDLPPEVSLLDPVSDIQMPANGIVPLLIEAQDPDFRLRFLKLRVEKEKELIQTRLILDGSQVSFRDGYDFGLMSLNLKPGEVISYWIEATDNKYPLGNVKNTPKLRIEIVESISEEEVKEELQAEKQRQQQVLEERERETGEAPEPSNSEAGSESVSESGDQGNKKPGQDAEKQSDKGQSKQKGQEPSDQDQKNQQDSYSRHKGFKTKNYNFSKIQFLF